jgi:hypothetical protein
MSNRDAAEDPGRRPAVSQSVLEERRTTAWIGKAVTIEGNVIATENLTVDGQVKGHSEPLEDHRSVGAGAGFSWEVR